jgi:hypothetical protein
MIPKNQEIYLTEAPDGRKLSALEMAFFETMADTSAALRGEGTGRVVVGLVVVLGLLISPGAVVV